MCLSEHYCKCIQYIYHSKDLSSVCTNHSTTLRSPASGEQSPACRAGPSASHAISLPGASTDWPSASSFLPICGIIPPPPTPSQRSREPSGCKTGPDQTGPDQSKAHRLASMLMHGMESMEHGAWGGHEVTRASCAWYGRNSLPRRSERLDFLFGFCSLPLPISLTWQAMRAKGRWRGSTTWLAGRLAGERRGLILCFCVACASVHVPTYV